VGRSPQPWCIHSTPAAGARRGQDAQVLILELASLVITGLMVAAVVLVGVLMLKVVFFVVTLPFRLLFAVLFFPIWIVKTILKIAVAGVVMPLVAIAGFGLVLIAAVAALAAVLLPLVPLLVVGLLLWAVFRSFRPAVA
jgi:hypothetical protein